MNAPAELLDALDRTDLLWFTRHAATDRTRRTMPAESAHVRALHGVRRPAWVTVRRLAPGLLLRHYDTGVCVLAQVGSAIVGEVSR